MKKDELLAGMIRDTMTIRDLRKAISYFTYKMMRRTMTKEDQETMKRFKEAINRKEVRS